MREYFDKTLQRYTDNLSQIANLVEETVTKSMFAFNKKDMLLAQEVLELEEVIHQKHLEIEREAFSITALQQPVADDLRLIFAVLASSSYLERITDHAVNISSIVLKEDREFESITELDQMINQMFTVVETMISGAVDAFIHSDKEAAIKFAQNDDQLDALLEEIKEISMRYMSKDSTIVDTGIDYLYVANCLERIGDYVTNICEQEIFLASNEQVSLN